MAAEGVVKFLLNKLADFLIEKGHQLTVVKDETEYISNELQYMTAFLKRADSREDSDTDTVLDLLVKRVRDVAFDTEDALDDFKLCLSEFHGLSCFEKICSYISNFRARRHIASNIQGIKSRVISISATHRRYCNNSNIMAQALSSSSILPLKRRRDALEEADLVGIAKRKKRLIEKLFSSKSEREVVSVVGMGGLGKSTLVKKVYNDPDVKKHFEFRAWITVSQSFKIENILKVMIQQLFRLLKRPDPQGLDSMDYDQLIMVINEFLQQRKYLIVLDDVWHMSSWEEDFKHALPNNSCGSRVLLTTRNKLVSVGCNNVYTMDPLSKGESRILFCKKIFQTSSCPRHLKKVSEKILGRCEGLPLAIVAISGVLATKEQSRIDEWEIVSRSLSARLEGNNRVKSILSLSYNDLPYYLKSCLLYFSIFPEVHPIECARLVRLWISEGFIIETEGMTLEEVAEGYLNELLQRSLIQVVKSTSDGRLKACRIHGLLRERITFKSRDQDFVAVVKDSSMMLPENVRRLSIHNATKHSQQIGIASRLRSLLMFWGRDCSCETTNFNLASDGLRRLNVLDLQGAPLKKFPNEVVNLLLLKYLSLRNTKVRSIPNSIGNLQSLETLDLKQSHVKELPGDILKLHKLRHLLVYRYEMEHEDEIHTKYGFEAPLKIGDLQSMQKLCFVEAKQGSSLLIDLGRLNQLRRLGIVKLRKEDGKALCFSIQQMRELRALSVTSVEENDIINMQYLPSPPPCLQRLYLTGRFEKIPKWISSLHCLVKLALRHTRLCDDPLIPLQHLPNLVHLDFVQVYDGETLRFKRGGFQRLKVLGLNKLDGLKSITVQKGAMPCLQHLIIQYCKVLQKVPYGIRHLTELKIVEFFDMSNDFIRRIRPDSGGEDYQKVKKVPEVYFTYQINGHREVYSLENLKKVKRPGPYWKP